MTNVFIECYRAMLAYFQHSMNLFQTKNAVVYWIFLSNLSRLSYVDPISSNDFILLYTVYTVIEPWVFKDGSGSTAIH